MLRRHIVLLIAIRPSDGDVKPGGPLGAFREEQAMSRDLWSDQKPWWNWYLTPVVNFGEVRRAQLAKSTLLTSTLQRWCPWDLFRSFKMLKREWGEKSNGKLPRLFIPRKTAILVPEFAVEDLPSSKLQPLSLSFQRNICLWEELQPWFPSLQWKTFLWAELQPWLLSLQWKTCLWAELQPWFLSLRWKTCFRQNC